MRLLALALVLLLSGCGWYPHGDGPGDGDALAGTWVLRSAQLGDSLYVPLDGERNVLRLRGGEARVESCNGCGGSYRHDPRSQTLAFTGLGCTEMACERQIDLGPMLGRAPLHYRVGDRGLVLRQGADAGGAVFTFRARD